MAVERLSNSIILDHSGGHAQPGITCDPANEIVLRLEPGDTLHVAWGGVVSQKAGVYPAQFGDDESHWLVFVNKGIFHAKIGNERFTVAKGQILVVLRGETCVGAEANDTDLQFQWLAFGFEESTNSTKLPPIRIPRIVDVPDPERIAQLVGILTEEFHVYQHSETTSPYLSSLGAQYLLLSILARLDPSAPRNRSRCSASTVLAERAKDYIRTNITTPITTSEVAKALDCSPGHLGIVFRKTYGETPVNYILRTRVGIASVFLRESRMSVGQIAAEVGFSSLNYFARVFRRYNGMSPTEYRIANSHLYVTTDI